MGKTKSVLLAAVAAAAFAMPASATLEVDLGTSTPTAIAGIGNDFESNLGTLGLTHYAAGYQSISVTNAPVSISVYRMGSESGLANFVNIDGHPYAESSPELVWSVSDDILVSVTQGNGPLGGNITFSNANDSSPLVSGNVALFLNPGNLDGSLYSGDDLYFGFNDSGSTDSDFDDYVIRITSAPVPEPATWAMMMVGLGLVGAGLRRRRTTVSFV